MKLRTLLLAGFGAAALSFSASAAAPTTPTSTTVIKSDLTQLAQGCWTDEGYGRKGPCGSFAKKKKKKKKSS